MAATTTSYNQSPAVNTSPYYSVQLRKFGIIASVTLLALIVTVVFLLPFGNMALMVTSPIFQAPLVTRLILKCACDLIIILDKAARVGGKRVTRRQIEEASAEYQRPIAGGEGSLKALVHRRINVLVPIVSAIAVRIYKKDQIEAIRAGIKSIVEGHRIPGEDVAIGVSISKMASVDTQSLADTLLGSVDDEDLKKLEELKICEVGYRCIIGYNM